MNLFWVLATAVALLALWALSGVRRRGDLSRLRGLPLATLILVPAVAAGVYALVGSPAALHTRSPTPATEGHAGSLEQLATRLAARLETEPDDVQGWRLLAGTYDYLGRADEARQAEARADALEGGHDADDAITTLRTRLEQNPRDVDGWALLGRTLQSRRRFAEAADAFAAATRLRPREAALWADRADAQAAANGGRLAPVAAFIDTALRLDPAESKALWLAATLALEQGHKNKALAYWRTLEKRLPQDDPQLSAIRANIAELTDAEAAAVLHGTVTLSDAAAAQLRAGDTLFVFARAAAGPPMPVAVWRAVAQASPTPFTLDDSTLMSRDRTMESAGPLVVGARISRSGNAMPSAGDWEAVPVPAAPGGMLSLVIDHQVKPQ